MQLNLGCGTKKLPGFVNIDIREEVNPDLIEDITKLESIKDESVDLIYACHVLEHINFWDVRKVLIRWYDILKPGGILRLSVPDMDAVFAHYFYWKDLKALRGFLWGGGDHEYNIHYSGWDYETLKEKLEDVFFDNIQLWNWHDIPPHNYIDDYSQVYWPTKNCDYRKNYPHVEGKLMSLNIEGVKPEGAKPEGTKPNV